MRVGSLCSGYGGLDLAVEEVFGARTVWHAEVDPSASKVLKARWDVPNHGDLTQIDWAGVEPIDIFTAGWPCQPWSAAGKQLGEKDVRAIWPEIARAIRELRPRVVVLENVSAVVVLGELARAAGDLAEARYDAQWTCLSASEVGAPHKRERFFIVATDTESGGGTDWSECSGTAGLDVGAVVGAGGGDHAGRTSEGVRHLGGTTAELADGVDLLPTPRASDGEKGGPNQRGSKGDLMLPSAVMLLPTPRTTDANGVGEHGTGGIDLRTAISLLPTPTTNYTGTSEEAWRARRPAGNGQPRETVGDLQLAVQPSQWGKYAAAIERWEQVTRPAPSPTEPNSKGNPRLSAAFAEWMMGLPAGWVTDVDLPRSAHLKILGNGVVPAQASEALRRLALVTQEER